MFHPKVFVFASPFSKEHYSDLNQSSTVFCYTMTQMYVFYIVIIRNQMNMVGNHQSCKSKLCFISSWSLITFFGRVKSMVIRLISNCSFVGKMSKQSCEGNKSTIIQNKG